MPLIPGTVLTPHTAPAGRAAGPWTRLRPPADSRASAWTLVPPTPSTPQRRGRCALGGPSGRLVRGLPRVRWQPRSALHSGVCSQRPGGQASPAPARAHAARRQASKAPGPGGAPGALGACWSLPARGLRSHTSLRRSFRSDGGTPLTRGVRRADGGRGRRARGAHRRPRDGSARADGWMGPCGCFNNSHLVYPAAFPCGRRQKGGGASGKPKHKPGPRLPPTSGRWARRAPRVPGPGPRWRRGPPRARGHQAGRERRLSAAAVWDLPQEPSLTFGNHVR